jgi:hypothetical protein
MIARSQVSDDIEFLPDQEVVVYVGDEDATLQPDTFQFCPLGVQLYTTEAMKECQMMELTLTLPTEADDEEEEQVQCIGFVAQCYPAEDREGLYRVWVKFLDLPPDVFERIRDLATSRKFTCPFCQNF